MQLRCKNKRQKTKFLCISNMIIIENQARNRCANYGDSFAAVSDYLKDWFVASDASETWGKVFSVVNVCNLED